MSHDLHFDVKEGRHAFYSALVPGWHGLGEVGDKLLTGDELLKRALIDWEVEKLQLHHPVTNDLINSYGIFRKDTGDFLGNCGKDYGIIQNHYSVDMVDVFLKTEDGKAHYETAGALGKGQVIWVLARVNGEIVIPGTDDKHKTFILFTTSHDGSTKATCKLTDVRVVCNNTLNQAIKGAGAYFSIAHRKNAEKKLEEAKKLMATTHDEIKSLEEKFIELAQRRVQKESINNVMKKLFGDADKSSNKRIENKIMSVLELFESNDKNQFPSIRGTAYNLLNAVTEYIDHYSTVRKTEAREDLSIDFIRTESALFGNGADFKEDALEIILEATAGDPRRSLRTIYASTDVPKKKEYNLLDSIIDNTDNN